MPSLSFLVLCTLGLWLHCSLSTTFQTHSAMVCGKGYIAPLKITSGLAVAFQAIHYITNTFYSAMNRYGISKKLSFDRWTASVEILENVKNLEYFSTTSIGFNNYASLICGKGSASSSAAKVDHLMCLMN